MTRYLYLFLGLVALCLLPLATSYRPRQHRRKSKETVCGYQSCPTLHPRKLNVHMVPHTHDDVGWVRTVDQYFYGLSPGESTNGSVNTHYGDVGVKGIIDSVVHELLKDPSRRFVYVETAFLWKWWQGADEGRQRAMRKLVNSGQLEFIGGSWSMNDEATTHYQSIIDQYTWGLRILNDTFGKCARPKVGWQIDPFGHSREMASLFAQMGYDGLFIGRLDYQDKYWRLRRKQAEMIWKGSPKNIGIDSDIFTHVLFSGYSPPPEFCFDNQCNDRMNDDLNSTSNNIPYKVRSFINFVKDQATFYKTKNVILTMGGDFHYKYANVWFDNMDKVIKYVNDEQESMVNVFYSTPSCYLKAVNKEWTTWPMKRDDFFPYASDIASYWTGYFTSKPTIKRFERLGNNFLQVCKQLSALARVRESGVTMLREAMGVMQHHDAISGTMQAHVASDYSKRLYDGFKQCGKTAQAAINKLMGNEKTTSIPVFSCLKLNISECAWSENFKNFVVTIWNPLSHVISHFVRLPVLENRYQIRDSNSDVTPSELVPIHNNVLDVPGRESAALYDLLFQAQDIPPLGFRSFHVSQSEPFEARDPSTFNIVISNGDIKVTLDKTGLTKTISMNGLSFNIRQSFSYYTGLRSSSLRSRSSGAYAFRPEKSKPTDIPITSFKVHIGKMVEEVHQVFGDGWVSQVIRLYKGEDHVEFEWMVGPIPNDTGKEVITLYQTNLRSGSTFYTDSNGREMLKRVRGFRPTWNLTTREPISSNYYPVTSKILIRDKKREREVAVLVDRAEGGSSIFDGQIELMLHRITLGDDDFGVDEALMEKAYGKGLVVRGKHYLVAGPLSSMSPTLAVKERLIAQRKLLAPWTFLTPTQLPHDEWRNLYKMELTTILNDALPKYVQILTLEPWKDRSLLLRLENILEKSDDPSLPPTVTVNLRNLFDSYPSIEVTGWRETTLAGNMLLSEAERLVWYSKYPSFAKHAHCDESEDIAVTLKPMEIRTFIIDVAVKTNKLEL